MHSIRIRDLDPSGFLAFDLKDLLNSVGEASVLSSWLCRGVWATPESPPLNLDIESVSDTGVLVAGSELLLLAAGTRQVIDGRFEAYRAGDSSPWLVLEAVDSTYWEVSCSDAATLELLRNSFRQVESRPDAA